MKNKEKELEIAEYNAETQRIRALSDHQVDANQMEMDAIQKILDESERDHQRDLAERSLIQGQEGYDQDE
jgi:hypothetical protein